MLLSLAVRLPGIPRSTCKFSAPCSSGACGSLYPRPAVFAGVAVHSIPVATTAQHVLWRECSGVVGPQWSPQQQVSRTGHDQHQDPGHGSEPAGRASHRDPRRRLALVPWDADCSGHHIGRRRPCRLEAAPRTKERRYPELSGRHGRTRLVVLGAEVESRWSQPKPRSVMSRRS